MFPAVTLRGGLTGIAEMLTPIDQPLDKLDDLTPEEMCVFFVIYLSVPITDSKPRSSENMKGTLAPPRIYARLLTITQDGWSTSRPSTSCVASWWRTMLSRQLAFRLAVSRISCLSPPLVSPQNHSCSCMILLSRALVWIVVISYCAQPSSPVGPRKPFTPSHECLSCAGVVATKQCFRHQGLITRGGTVACIREHDRFIRRFDEGTS